MKIPTPPAYLDDRAIEIFLETTKDLAPPLTATDRNFLAAYSQHLSDYERLTDQIHSDGDIQPDQNGVSHKHPLSIPQAKYFDMMTKAAASLGIERKQRIKSVTGKKGDAKTRSLRKAPRTKAAE